MSPSSKSKVRLSKRSCTRCSQRKVRCDRKIPACGQCSKHNSNECVYPADKRAPRKLNRPPIPEILVQLKQLEEEVERLQSVSAKQSLDLDDQTCVRSLGPRTEDHNSQSDTEKVLDTPPSGRLVIRDGRSRYVGDEASVVLGAKIRELREICYRSSAEENATKSNIGPLLVPGGGISGSGHSASVTENRINSPKTQALWDCYITNVAPLISFLHLPSVERMIGEGCADPYSNSDSGQESLILAICFAAVVSMTPQQCLSTLNEDHDICIHDYKVAVTQALVKANLISTQDIHVLQAAVLFLLCLRRYGDSRIVWAEASIVIRVAQFQGIHRDGERLGLPPFEIEMRRRLWWHICILDMLCSEDQGTATQIRPEMFDTKIPSNINNSELNPQLIVLPPSQEGFTDITLCTIQCETMSNLYWVGKSLNQDTQQQQQQPSAPDRGRLLSQLADRLETLYLRHFDLDIPIQWLTAVIARLTLSKAWLVHNLNAASKTPNNTNISARNDEIFAMGVEILQFARLLQSNEITKQWAWLCKSYKQRHVAAFILSELCIRPNITSETEQAWKVVTELYSKWMQEDSQPNDMLQTPLSRLMDRAALSREKKLVARDVGAGVASPLDQYSNNSAQQPANPAAKTPNDPAITAPGSTTDLPPYGFVHQDIGEGNLGDNNAVLSEVPMLGADTVSSEFYDFSISSLDWLTGPLF